MNARIFRMNGRKLLGRRELDALSNFHQGARLVLLELEPQLFGRDYGVDHAAIGDVHMDSAESRHVDGLPSVNNERWHIAERYAPAFSSFALRFHTDDTCWRIDA